MHTLRKYAAVLTEPWAAAVRSLDNAKVHAVVAGKLARTSEDDVRRDIRGLETELSPDPATATQRRPKPDDGRRASAIAFCGTEILAAAAVQERLGGQQEISPRQRSRSCFERPLCPHNVYQRRTWTELQSVLISFTCETPGSKADVYICRRYGKAVLGSQRIIHPCKLEHGGPCDRNLHIDMACADRHVLYSIVHPAGGL